MGFSLVGHREGPGGVDAKGRTFNRRYTLNADSDSETVVSALSYLKTTVGIDIGTAHPSYTFAQALNISPSREDNSNRIFYFDVEYATNALRTNNPSAEAENPLLEPSRRAFSTQTVTRTVVASPITGAPIMNSAGTITPIDWQFTEFILTIIRNEPIETISHYSNYHDTIDNAGGSSTGILGAYPGEILLTIRHGEMQFKANTWYVEVAYELHAQPRVEIQRVFNTTNDPCPIYNANGSIKNATGITGINMTDDENPVTGYVSVYDILALQQGYEFWNLNGSDWTLHRFKDANGEDASEPQLLDIRGRRLLAQNMRLGGTGQPTDPVYRVMTGKRRVNFADLNLLAV